MSAPGRLLPAAAARNRAIGSALVVLAAAGVAVFFANFFLRPDAGRVSAEVQFCRKTFTDLTKGRRGVQEHIRWERLRALGLDVGQSYSMLKSQQDQRRYQTEFISGFANGFQRTGTRAGAFVNWRIQQRRDKTVTVAADLPTHRKTLLFEVSTDGTRQLEGIRWLERDERG